MLVFWASSFPVALFLPISRNFFFPSVSIELCCYCCEGYLNEITISILKDFQFPLK